MAQFQNFQEFVLDALEVVEFKLIRAKSEVDTDDMVFHPAMAHQIFGESESIFGYRNLHVRIMYTAGPMYAYIKLDYDCKVDDIIGGDVKADNVVATIAKTLPEGCYFINLDEFLRTLDKAETFRPFGEKLSEHTHLDSKGENRVFEIYHSNSNCTPFLKLFQRLQTFILWFIDAASYIDVDDDHWNYFVCYEKYKDENGHYQYATTGYSTIYEYYAYPENKRPRISQMLVLPPFQKMGIGTKFLETIYQYYQGQKSVIDITVEDPSDDFQSMRNYVDARLCKDLKCFSKDEITKGFSKRMVLEARQNFKINARQVRRVYEILRLFNINIHDQDEYTAYRLDVKARLNAVYHKQVADIKKMENQGKDTEWLRARLPSASQRIEQLSEEYKVVEKEYLRIVNKLRLLKK